MRLPGAWYIGADGQPVAQTRITHASDRRYSVEEVMANVGGAEEQPTPQQERPAPSAAPRGNYPPRTLQQVMDALRCYPVIAPKTGQRPKYMTMVWGLREAVREAGGSDELALELIEAHSPGVVDATEYLKTEPHTIGSSKFFSDAFKFHGWRTAGARPDDLDGFEVLEDEPDPDDEVGAKREGKARAETPPQPTNKAMLLAEVQQRLTDAVAEGASAADMTVLRLRLATASQRPASELLGLQLAIEQEHEARSAIAAEARTLRAEQDRQEIGQAITLDYLFPPSLAEALRTRCRYLPADAPSTALSFLTGLAGLVKLGSEVIGIRAADFRVPLNLFTALVGKSGAKKSPLRKLVVDQPAAPLALDLARAHSRAMEDWSEQNKGLPKSDRTDPPEPVYVSISSTTVEALAQQLQRQEGKGLGLLVNRDELSGLFGSLGAYKSGRGDDEQFFLEAFDGGGLRILRVSTPGGGRSYESCSLSIYGTVQPGVLEQLVASGDDSGLWARFLFVPLPQKVVPLPEIETELEIEQASAAAAALAQACSAVYRMPRISLELSPEARRAFTRYEGNAQQEAIRASIGAQSALWGKAAGKVLRIAGLLHLLQLAAPDGQASELITADTMERATALVDHINGWTLSLHADLAQSGASDLMRLVHRIAMEAQQPIKWKEIAPRLSGKQRKEIDSAAVAMAMEALVELGVGEIEQGSRGAVIYRATAALP
jgi:hypothetical protein